MARLGRLLGIGVFRALLVAFFWGHARNRARFFDGTRQGIEALDVETRRAEFGISWPASWPGWRSHGWLSSGCGSRRAQRSCATW
ncbi:MAG: hypothetical protein ACI8QZ_003482 [Chlamydiales bacterium]|jgi:hypothetical protein